MSRSWAIHNNCEKPNVDLVIENVSDSLHAALTAMNGAERASSGAWVVDQKTIDVDAALGMSLDTLAEWHVNILGLFTMILRRTHHIEIEGMSMFRVKFNDDFTSICIRWTQTEGAAFQGVVESPVLWPNTTIRVRANGNGLETPGHTCVLHFDVDFLG